MTYDHGVWIGVLIFLWRDCVRVGLNLNTLSFSFLSLSLSLFPLIGFFPSYSVESPRECSIGYIAVEALHSSHSVSVNVPCIKH